MQHPDRQGPFPGGAYALATGSSVGCRSRTISAHSVSDLTQPRPTPWATVVPFRWGIASPLLGLPPTRATEILRRAQGHRIVRPAPGQAVRDPADGIGLHRGKSRRPQVRWQRGRAGGWRASLPLQENRTR